MVSIEDIEIEEAKANIFKILKPILPYNEEMRNKDPDIRVLYSDGTKTYYKKCITCGRKYHYEILNKCPHEWEQINAIN